VATRQAAGTRAKDTDHTMLGMKPADVKNTYLSFDPSRDYGTPGALSIDVQVSSDYGSGYIELAGDGTVEQINYPG
jgi:hypothetical protein